MLLIALPPPEWLSNFYNTVKNGVVPVKPEDWKLGSYIDFHGQYISRDEQTKLYVRHFYNELFELIKGNGTKYHLLLGNPGIGKSAFGIYLICRFFDEKREILYQTDADTSISYWFKREEVVLTNVSAMKIMTENPNTVYISDGNMQPALVQKGKSYCISIASTQCIAKNLHEHRKRANFKYYMPMFKEQEIDELLAIHKHDIFTVDAIKLRYKFFGGMNHVRNRICFINLCMI